MGVAVPIIAAGISAGTQIWGAKKAADTAKQAAGQQMAGVDRAIAVQTPYMQAGQQAMSTLSGLMGLGGTQPGAGPAGFGTGPLVGAPVAAQRAPAPLDATIEGKREPGGIFRESRAPGESVASLAGRGSSYATRSVLAPNGQVYQIPGHMVAEAVQNGGRLVGAGGR